PCGLSDRSMDGVDVAPDAFELAVNNELRGVDAARAKDTRLVLRLASCERCRRERIPPPQPIPIIHVLAETQDVHPAHRLAMYQLIEDLVGRWTTGTAFGREQFGHYDGLIRRWRRCLHTHAVTLTTRPCE